MDLREYQKIKNYSYKEACEYFLNKYGKCKAIYGSKINNRSDEGLFIHHIGENEIASLSNPEVRKANDPKYQEPEMLVYCNYLEHAFIHVLIGEETAGGRNLGLHGDNLYIIPALRKFFEEGLPNPRINAAYFDVIKNDKDVYDLIFARYNKTVEDADIVLDQNKTLYLQVEDKLNTVGKALVVLGTGLGKTTTALQYLWKHQCRALVIGPNNLIKSSWENYGSWVDTTTYQSFAHDYRTIDYTQYGLVILDEAHHAGYDEESEKGAKVWSEGINYLINNNIIKVLGLTATPERSDKIDIGKTIFKNCVCEGLAVEDAIEQGIIHPFSYITAIYDTQGLVDQVKEKFAVEDDQCRKLFGQLDLAINNTPSLKETILKYMPKDIKRKGIIFIQEIADKIYVQDVFKDIYPDMEYRCIDSRMDGKEVEVNRKWFEETDEGYLLAVNMISEGAHYKGVNTLIMFRRTESYLVYTQQLGRIITLMKDEDPNAIVFDLVNNIENIRYNDRKLNKKKKEEHSITKIIRALEKVKSEQIIIANETRDITECIRNIKSYADSTWQDWEDEIIRTYYPTESVKGCMERINKRWEELGNKKRSEDIIRYRIKVLRKHEEFIEYKSVEWTENELEIVKKYYPLEGPNCYKRLENRTPCAVKGIAKKLNVFYDLRSWSDTEDNILKDKYHLLSIQELCKLLPNRNAGTIRTRASFLKLKKNSKSWTEEENTILKEYYPIEGTECYKRFLNRTKNSCACQARKLHLIYTSRYFSKEEESIILEYYPIEGGQCYKRLINKTVRQVNSFASRLNIKYNGSWTEEEINIVKRYYSLEGENITKRLPNKTIYAIRSYANKHNIFTNKRRNWTTQEDDILKQYYPTEGYKCYVRFNNRTISMVKNRAMKLGIQSNEGKSNRKN